MSIMIKMIKTLERVVVECGHLVINIRSSGAALAPEDKAEQLGQHFSTLADRESQELGLSVFQREMPGEAIIAEEQENNSRLPQDCTVFDPLDGSTNYFNQSDDFGVTAATLRNGQVVAGATYLPAHNILVSAVRGEGCWVSGFGIGRRVTSIAWHGILDKTQIGTDVGSWTHQCGSFDMVLCPLSWRFNVLSDMSSVIGGARVLFGKTGVYYNLGIAKVWDAAAMTLAVEEAGGVSCAPDGGSLTFTTVNCDWVSAVNRELADVVLKHTRVWARLRNGREF